MILKPRGTAIRHCYTVNILLIRTKCSENTFIVRTPKEWNFLPESVFPESYNLGIFKTRVKRLLRKRASLSTTHHRLPSCEVVVKRKPNTNNKKRINRRAAIIKNQTKISLILIQGKVCSNSSSPTPSTTSSSFILQATGTMSHWSCLCLNCACGYRLYGTKGRTPPATILT